MKKRKEQYTMLLDKGEQGIVVSGHKEKQQKKQDAWYYLGFVGQIGYSIALPIVGGALLGAYIDRVRSTYPKATIFLLFVGFVLSFIAFVKTIQELIKKSNS
jgi:F0F1-type ATP synthase assembly protein I